MGRGLLACVPLASAALLLSCLLRPSGTSERGRDARLPGDSRARSDASEPRDAPPHMDATNPDSGGPTSIDASVGGVCPTKLDDFLSGSCGTYGVYDNGVASASAGTLTLGTAGGCSWNHDLGKGVLVHISSGPTPELTAMTTIVVSSIGGTAMITAHTKSLPVTQAPGNMTPAIEVDFNGSMGTVAGTTAYVDVAISSGKGTVEYGPDPASLQPLGTSIPMASGPGSVGLGMSGGTMDSVQFNDLECQ